MAILSSPRRRPADVVVGPRHGEIGHIIAPRGVFTIRSTTPYALWVSLPHLLTVALLRFNPLRVVPGAGIRTLTSHRDSRHGSRTRVTSARLFPSFLIESISRRLSSKVVPAEVPLLRRLTRGDVVALPVVITTRRHIPPRFPLPFGLAFRCGLRRSYARRHTVVTHMARAKRRPAGLARRSRMAPTPSTAVTRCQKCFAKGVAMMTISVRRALVLGYA